jgi:hypothetical protein
VISGKEMKFARPLTASVLPLLMLFILVLPASILVLPASADSMGPSTTYYCNQSNYDVTIVAGPGTISGTVNGTTVTYTAAGPSSGNSIGADDIVRSVQNAAANGTPVKVNINFPSKKLFVSPDATVDLMGYSADIAFSVGNLILAGALRVQDQRTISIDAASIDQITCPQTNLSSHANGCPDSIGMHAVLFGGTLQINGVATGVGESSCPKGQVITEDIAAITLTVANAPPPSPPPPPPPSIRVCLNVNLTSYGNVQIAAKNIGANRGVFVRLNSNNGDVRSATVDPTAHLFVGGGTPLCY